jgi:hypothetical protein
MLCRISKSDPSPLSQTDGNYFTPSKLTIYHSRNASELPIIIDSGASSTVSPVLSYFVGPLHPSILTSLQGLSVKSNVVGEGNICWTIWDALGQVHQLWTKTYFVPDVKICLFSPHKYLEECNNDPFVTFNKSGANLGLDDGSILSFAYQWDSNTPMMLTNNRTRTC